MNDMFAFLRESGEKPEPNSGMKIMAGVSHSPKRIHDYEKHYSPALKGQRGYSSISELKEQEEREAEEERREKCTIHEAAHRSQVEGYQNSSRDEKTLEESNNNIRHLNSHFSRWGCPPLPEIEREPPTFAAKR